MKGPMIQNSITERVTMVETRNSEIRAVSVPVSSATVGVSVPYVSSTHENGSFQAHNTVLKLHQE